MAVKLSYLSYGICVGIVYKYRYMAILMRNTASPIRSREELRQAVEASASDIADRHVPDRTTLLGQCVVRYSVETDTYYYTKGCDIFFINEQMYVVTRHSRLKKFHDKDGVDKFRDKYGLDLKVNAGENVVKARFKGIDTGFRYKSHRRTLDYSNHVFTCDVVNAEYITRDIEISKGGSRRAVSKRTPPDRGMSVIGIVQGCGDEHDFGIPADERIVFLANCTRLTKVGIT